MIKTSLILAILLTGSPRLAWSAPDPGTQQMAQRLQAQIRAAGTRDPSASLRRAELCRQRLPHAGNPSQEFGLRLELATELMRGGRSEEALREFRDLRDWLQQRGLLSPANRTSLGQLIAVSWLRLGETENCQANHTSQSCLFPIREGGVHTLPRGSRGAIPELTALLEKDANDLGTRWLLNIAYMTLGEYPEEVPSAWLIAPHVFESEYPLPRFPEIAGPAGLDVDDLAGGSIVDDFDGDNLLDVVCSSMKWQGQLRLLRNDGDGSFSDRTEAAGLTGEVGGLNINQADYNNDGAPDILVLRGGWQQELGRQPLSLLRNNRDGTFSDVTEAAGLLRFHPTQTAVWFDYDNDGWLDLFVGNETAGAERGPCELFHNQQDGTFTDCAAASGLAISAFVKGVASGDFNNDGRPDLYLSCLGEPNRLLRNDGSATPDASSPLAWRFTDVTDQAGVAEPIPSFPTWFFDYDNDGWEDIFVSGYFMEDLSSIPKDYLGLPHDGATPRLYRNNHDGTFSNVTEQLGLDRLLLTMGANFGDLDNDGFLDFYVGTGAPDLSYLMPNRMFRNAAGRRFQDVTTAGGFGHLQKGHGISFADLDNDGDQDVYAELGGMFPGDNYRNALFHNPGHNNHWLTLKLVGQRSNKSGVGVRIAVTVRTAQGSQTIHKTGGTGGSFGSSPLRQEIGLGKAEAIDQVEVYWPASGRRQTFKELELDRFYEIRENQSEAVVYRPKTFQFKTGLHVHHD